jgi:hypothetical protein
VSTPVAAASLEEKGPDGRPLDPDVRNDDCSNQWAAGKALKKALSALETWSKALANLAAAGDFDADDVKTAASDGSDAAKALGGGDSVTGAIKALGDPLTALASVVVAAWADKKVEQAISETAPKAKEIAQKLQVVVDRMIQELILTQNQLLALIAGDAESQYALRRTLLGNPQVAGREQVSGATDAAGVLAVYNFATSEGDKLELLQRQLLADRAALSDLVEAIGDLQLATKGGNDKQKREALLNVVKHARDAAAGFAGVRTALSGK